MTSRPNPDRRPAAGAAPVKPLLPCRGTPAGPRCIAMSTRGICRSCEKHKGRKAARKRDRRDVEEVSRGD